MFDRQARNRCTKTTVEYALVKKEDKKIGRMTFPVYELDPEYDKKNPADSKVMWDAAQVEVDDGAGAADDKNAKKDDAIPEGMPTE